MRRAKIELEGREGGQQLAVIPALGKPVAYVYREEKREGKERKGVSATHACY